MVVTDYAGRKLNVLLRNPDGTFQAPREHTGFGDIFLGVSLLDVNGDGHLDLVVRDTGTTVGIALGNGDGSFRAMARIVTGIEPIGVALGDYNGDSIPDLAVTNSFSFDFVVLLGDGAGGFLRGASYSTGRFPTGIVTDDFNRDGVLDLALIHFEDFVSVVIFTGNGDGTFRRTRDMPVAFRPGSLRALDLDGDGFLDLITVNSNSHNVAFLRGRGDGTFDSPAFFGTEVAPGSSSLGDLDGDGRLDMIVVTGGRISILMNNTP